VTTADCGLAVERAPCGTLHALDTSDLRGGYVLDCDSGVQVRLSTLAYRVLAAAWAGASFDEIALQCSDGERRFAARDVEHVYDRVVAGIEAAEQRRRRHAIEQGFLLRLTLLPAGLVGRMAVPFAALFGRTAAGLCMAVLVACAATYGVAMHAGPAPPVGGYDLFAGYGLFVLSCLAHELGHAGACARFGVRPGSIGLALYLVFPVFYSDVSRIWRLNRRQRIAVDVGGLYVQCLCGAGYALLYLQTHSAAFFLAVSLISAAALLDLNPLFRFDGYWIVSDALGVSGLHSQVLRTLRRFTGCAVTPAPVWPSGTAAAVAIYSSIALAAWVWFAIRILGYAFDAGRWLLAAVPAAAKHDERAWLVGLCAGAILVGFAVTHFLRRALHADRGATAT
jgi:putative peptide zinc metalloprotease protein